MTHLEHHYAEINGVNVHYVEAGPQDITVQGKQTKTLIFLHGFPEYWGDLATANRPLFQTVPSNSARFSRLQS